MRGDQVAGVTTTVGEQFESSVVIVTTGTFLKGICHIGLTRFEGGRAGEIASVGLSDSLASLGLEMGRLKTGTGEPSDGSPPSSNPAMPSPND